MNDNILTNEQWSELCRAVSIFDQKSDRTTLNQILVSIMKSIIESLDDDDAECEPNQDNDMEKQLVIALIESELAELIAVNACPSWCCRRQRIRPIAQNTHRFSDYLINLARAKSSDQNNSGYIPKDVIQRCFQAQLNDRKMAELLSNVQTNKDGNINYRDFTLLMLIAQ